MKKLGKYEIIEELGRGAMGVVYKARDPFIGRLVALKTITTGLQDQPELLQRFYREAQAAGGLQHPNVVTIYDLGEGDGTPYIAMEFLEGEDVEKVITERRPLPLSQKIGYMVQAARALDYAHKRGVVHRDIKPANIVVTKDGTIKVVDFGIARLVDTSRSQTGLLIGTVNYMSPEQVRGERVDGRSDIFSFGVMFYELVCYERPFVGNNFTAVMLAIISTEPRALRELAPDCPPELEKVIHKILRKNVEERYQSLDEFLIDVDPVWKKLQHQTVSELVTQSEKLIQQKQLTQARDMLRQAILIDTSHTHAKTLLEKVSAEMKRSIVLPQAQEHVSKAEALLKDGKVEEASAEAQAALKLDSVYQPAQDILKKIQDATSRQQQVKEYMRVTRQRLAEGSLTEAEQSLRKLLELETGKEADELRRQLEEEKVRRERRKKLLETMQQARNLWTQQQFDECIQLLTGLQKEFPGEGEVTKFLETVQEDRAEQEKHQKLAEARNMLAAQRFSDALAVMEPLAARYKDDPAVTKLYDHIQQERRVHAQRVRLEREQTALRKLVADEKFQEAVSKGELLLGEFPEEVELARLVEFAKSQQAMVDQQRRLKERIKEVEAHYDKANWEQCIKAADAALEAFPGNQELKHLLDDARAKFKDKEKHDYVEKQIRSMKAAMATGNLTDAIDLGRQTIAQVRHDTDVTQLLQFAERERDLRDKKREQEDQLKTVAILLQKEQFDEASKVLKAAEKTQIFNPLDPRIQELQRAIQEKRTPSEAVLEKGLPSETIAAQYVYAPGRPSPAEPAPVSPVAASPASQPQASTTPMPVTPTPAPPPAMPEKGRPEADFSATRIASPQAVPAPPPPAPPKEPPKKAKPFVEEPPVKEAPPKKGKPAVEEKKKPVVEKREEPVKARPAVPEKGRPEADFSTTRIASPQAVGEELKKKPAVEPPPPRKEEVRPTASATSIFDAKQRPSLLEPPVAAPRPAPVAREAVAPAPPFAVPEEAPKKSPVVMIAIAAVVLIGISIGVWKFMGSSGGGGTATPEETALQTQAQQLYTERKLNDALAKFRELAGKNGALKADADAKAGEIDKILQDEKAAFDAGKSAQAQKSWAAAEENYNKVVHLDGMLKQQALAALDTVRMMKSGRDPAAMERETFKSATDAASKRDWARAQQLFKTVIDLNGANRAKAEDALKVAETRFQEKKVYDEGMAAINAGQKDAAKAKFQEVISMNGLLRADADRQIRIIDGQLNTEKARQELTNQAKGLIAQGDFPGARAMFQQITQLGGDVSSLSAEIAAAEQRQIEGMVQRFNQAKSRDDEGILNSLQGEFRNVASAGGSKAEEARGYAEREIPAAMKEIGDKRTAAAAAAAAAGAEKERQQFEAAKNLFDTAVNNKDVSALNSRVKSAFQPIAQGSGKYAAEAGDYLNNRIPAAVKAARPCPNFAVVGGGGGMTQNYKAGDNVPAGLLDAKPAWTTCPWPAVGSLAMLSMTIDESGNVSEVKPRGTTGADTDAAMAAIKGWKVTPAPKYKGLAVKTNTAVDIKP